MSVKFKNMATTLASIQRRQQKTTEAIQNTTAGIAQLVLQDATDRAPVETGELRASGRVNEVKDGHEVTFTADHAVVVHEDLEAFHPVGEAKFLAKAVRGARQLFRDRVIKDVRA